MPRTMINRLSRRPGRYGDAPAAGFGFAWLVPILLAAWVAWSAGDVRAQAPAAAVPAVRSAIPTAEILDRADADQRLVDRVARRAAAPDPSAPLQDRLDEIARSVDQKARAFRGDDLEQLPVARLESLARHWSFDARRFDAWTEDARRALAPLAQDADLLTRRRLAWDATRAAVDPALLPPALAGRVDAVREALAGAEQVLSVPLARQIALGQRANAVDAQIQAGRAEAMSAIQDVDRRLLQRDSPPLWSAATGSPSRRSPAEAIREGLQIESRFARDYASTPSGNRIALVAAHLVLLPTMIWLASRARRAPVVHDGWGDPATVLARPFSAWLLLATLAVLVLEPDAPLMATAVVMALALIPTLRLLPRERLAAIPAWPVVAVVLYVLNGLGLVVLAAGELFRLFQLALTAGALLLTLWLLRRTRRADASAGAPSRGLRRIRLVGAGGGLLLLIALVSNVVGNVSLAETLTGGLIESGYLSLLLYAGVTVCIALLRALLAQPELQRISLIRDNGPALQTFLTGALIIAALLGWLVYTLQAMRVLRPVGDWLAALLDHDVELGEISLSLGHVLVFAASLLVAFWSARIARRLLRNELLERESLPRGVGNSIASLSYYAVLLVGFLLALSAAGFQVSQLALLFGALGVGIGFGLQNIINHLVSGLVLMFERPIQPGDIVDVAGTAGRVREIGMRATIIRTFDGADVVVPNGNLLSANLTNWTLYDRRRRIEVTVGVAPGSDPRRVTDVLVEAARALPGVAMDPPPSAQLTTLGRGTMEFTVHVWTHDFERWGTLRSELMCRIPEALAAQGVRMPSGQYDVNVRTVVEPGQERSAPTIAPAGETAAPGRDDTGRPRAIDR